MEFMSTAWWSALLAIILIDLVLAGDNAIVIALAARSLPPALQRKAVVWGTVGAIAVRSVMTVGVVWLLKIPGLMLVGGLGLLWIAYKLLADADVVFLAEGDSTDETFARLKNLGVRIDYPVQGGFPPVLLSPVPNSVVETVPEFVIAPDSSYAVFLFGNSTTGMLIGACLGALSVGLAAHAYERWRHRPAVHASASYGYKSRQRLPKKARNAPPPPARARAARARRSSRLARAKPRPPGPAGREVEWVSWEPPCRGCRRRRR